MTRTVRTGAMTLLAAGLLLGGGCGLTEYEKKLEVTQKFLDEVDKENEYLGDPVVIPQKKEGSSGPAAPVAPALPPSPTGKPQQNRPSQNIFFRPPKGISSEGAETSPGSAIYRYGKATGKSKGGGPLPPSPGVAPPSPGGGRGTVPQPPKENAVQEVYLAISVNNPKPETFWDAVLQNFGNPDRSKARKDVKTPAGRKPLTFDSFTDGGSPPSTYIDLFTEKVDNAQYQVVIVYKVDPTKGKGEYFDKQLNYSLQSLMVGRDAARRFQNFRGTSGS